MRSTLYPRSQASPPLFDSYPGFYPFPTNFEAHLRLLPPLLHHHLLPPSCCHPAVLVFHCSPGRGCGGACQVEVWYRAVPPEAAGGMAAGRLQRSRRHVAAKVRTGPINYVRIHTQAAHLPHTYPDANAPCICGAYTVARGVAAQRPGCGDGAIWPWSVTGRCRLSWQA